MVGTRLPEHVLNQVLIRLDAGESVRRIHKDLDVSRNCIYILIKNIDLWGIPYPPATVKPGRTRLLKPFQEEVRDSCCLGIAVTSLMLYRASLPSSKTSLLPTSLRCSSTYMTCMRWRLQPEQLTTILTAPNGHARLRGQELQSEIKL